MLHFLLQHFRTIKERNSTQFRKSIHPNHSLGNKARCSIDLVIPSERLVAITALLYFQCAYLGIFHCINYCTLQEKLLLITFYGGGRCIQNKEYSVWDTICQRSIYHVCVFCGLSAFFFFTTLKKLSKNTYKF